MHFTESGPVDILMLKFPGIHFRREIATALRDLVVRDLVRVIDLLFVFKTAEGQVSSTTLAELRSAVDPVFVGLEGQLGGGLLDSEDVEEVAPVLAEDSSVAVVVVENCWALPFISAVRRSGGEVIDRARLMSVHFATSEPTDQNGTA
jgi:hypothetical protein